MSIKQQSSLFTLHNVSAIVLSLYGLHTEAQPLPGERDYNFRLRSTTGETFVLKIAPAGEPKDILDLQNKALAHLAASDSSLLVPRVYPLATGEPIATVTDRNGTKHSARLLSYIPGKHLADTRPHTPALLHSLGSLMGRFDAALQNFTHPAAERVLKWDVRHALWIRDYLHYIANPQRRAIVENHLAYFEEHVLPILPTLRTSIIHHDANDYNVLVRKATPTEPARVISVIDFGDMVLTYIVCEPAIAATYAMLGKADPLAAAVAVVGGYHEAFPLTETELAVLYPFICMRLCVSVVNSAYQQQIEPDNAYLTISEQPAWVLLEQLGGRNELRPYLDIYGRNELRPYGNVHTHFAHYILRHACHLPPCPQTEAVTRWLKDNAHTFSSVVEADLHIADMVVFDLSVSSRELSNLVDFSDIRQFNRHIFGRMMDAESKVGIGRYNETRLIYTGDQYKIAGNDGPEWRTVHIGLDVFMKAGTPVLAPLDGIVHSFHNNAVPLDYGPTIILQHTIPDETNQPITFYTLYGHLSLDSLDGLYEGKPVAKGTSFCKMGSYEVNGGWPPHLHFQIITDLLGNIGNFPGVARPSQRNIWLSLSPDPNLIMGIPSKHFPEPELSSRQVREKRTAHIGPSLSVSYQQPLRIVRGLRQYLYDEHGQAYLDAVNNVSHVGHCHPRVVRAGQEQMAVLNTNTRYLHDALVNYAERLCATLPPALSVCYFVCSGSEANELALRLARTYTKQKDVIVIDVAYHGNTAALVEISPYKFNGPGGTGAPPYVHVVLMPDGYRGLYKASDPLAAQKYAMHVEEVIQQVQQQGGNIAAFIGESLLGCGGQIVLPDGYLAEVYRYVRKAGGVCIADEVQVGFGRVGTHFWGFETQGVVPDIVTMGKPIGNGHPLAAVVTTPEIANAFNNGMEYFNTFGGNPVSCAIGLSVLNVIEDEHLQANALHIGNYLLQELRHLMDKHPLIGDVRGLGLFIGIELVLDRETLEPAPLQTSYLANRMRERGILLSTDGPFHNVLKIKPPLVFNKENADFLVATLDEILGDSALS